MKMIFISCFFRFWDLLLKCILDYIRLSQVHRLFTDPPPSATKGLSRLSYLYLNTFRPLAHSYHSVELFQRVIVVLGFYRISVVSVEAAFRALYFCPVSRTAVIVPAYGTLSIRNIARA